MRWSSLEFKGFFSFLHVKKNKNPVSCWHFCVSATLTQLDKIKSSQKYSKEKSRHSGGLDTMCHLECYSMVVGKSTVWALQTVFMWRPQLWKRGTANVSSKRVERPSNCISLIIACFVSRGTSQPQPKLTNIWFVVTVKVSPQVKGTVEYRHRKCPIEYICLDDIKHLWHEKTVKSGFTVLFKGGFRCFSLPSGWVILCKSFFKKKANIFVLLIKGLDSDSWFSVAKMQQSGPLCGLRSQARFWNVLCVVINFAKVFSTHTNWWEDGCFWNPKRWTRRRRRQEGWEPSRIWVGIITS